MYIPMDRGLGRGNAMFWTVLKQKMEGGGGQRGEDRRGGGVAKMVRTDESGRNKE